jgi:hypothetical protein
MTPRQQLELLVAKFDPEVSRTARAVLRKMRSRLPAARQLVYDNYNALAIGFSPTDRPSDAILSVAVYPRWVSLFFFNGAALPDPGHILKGTGNRMRHIVLNAAADLDAPAVQELIALALRRAHPALPATGRGAIVIKSVSAKQRQRRSTTAPASRRRR